MRRIVRAVVAFWVVWMALGPARGEEIRVGLAAPLTGHFAWNGAIVQNGVEQAVADLNEAGGVLGRRLEVDMADDYCDAEQAKAAARKLIADRVALVVGHQCSAAALPTSEIYQEAGLLFITPGATNPKLTDRGFWNVFRTAGRDDDQARLWVETLAARWAGKRIAVVHDTTVWAMGLVEEVKRRLAERAPMDVRFERIEPGRLWYGELAAALVRGGVEVVALALYTQEAGLLTRQLREAGSRAQILAGDSASSEEFGLLAGPASEGVLMSQTPQVKTWPSAQALVARLDKTVVEGKQFSFRAYAALQAWAEAARRAGTLDGAAVARELKSGRFDTVLGEIGFDEKGDIVGNAGKMVWHVWRDGTFHELQ